ncbi:vitamin B12 biosynthesis CobW-like protein [Baffinella frigidus]|nr:vitamin B12 biosynthesis CobW-like protein [Cryptophyta sp. CCMP2293]
MAALAEERSDDLYRIKGILSLEKSDSVYVFQGVCGELKGRAMRKWGEGEERRSELVLIGKNLDPAPIQASFRSCLVSGGG